MGNVKEISDRMKSIGDTMKITNAMYMISSSKLKRARRELEETEPYFFTLQQAMGRILRHMPKIDDIYFKNAEAIKKENRKTGYIVVTADKGLSGSYNHNVMKLAEAQLKESANPTLFVLGELGRFYFEQHGVEITKQFHYTVQNPTLTRARNIAETIINDYNQGMLDEVYIIFTRMVNAAEVETQMMKLLPFEKEQFQTQIPVDVRMEELAMLPSPKDVMDRIIPDYIVGFIFGALVESYTSEQNSRMMAMDAATKSAKDMLHELSIQYNRARQAAITQEITEVISGAKAQKNKKKR